jgi:hypothetical protein
MAEAVSGTTGVAISPLLGVSAVGAWRWAHTPEAARDALPWYASPWFWAPAALLVLLLALKEPMLYFLPGAKKPLDLLEVFENKASALIAAPVVIDLAIKTFAAEEAAAGTAAGVVTAGWGNGLALAVTCVALLLVFGCVWLSAHAVNMLILLSPSATLDMLLRGARTSVLGAVVLSAVLNPWLGLLVALLVIYVATRLFGWSWRLMIYGSTVAADWLRWRKEPGVREDGTVPAFLLRATDGLPARASGSLGLDVTGQLVFRARPLPWLPEAELRPPPSDCLLVRALPGPDLQVRTECGRQAIIGLPPRYRGAEESIAAAWSIEGSSESTVSRGWQAALAWLQSAVAPSARFLNSE